ncbi:hypothetical protein [Nonomuraea sp. NPDC049758]|uniref:hypothetical protein n=1 Tax=Nonomuraea sp. NPDC049758 TaxID=3154360 RepID=UPI003436D3BC
MTAPVTTAAAPPTSPASGPAKTSASPTTAQPSAPVPAPTAETTTMPTARAVSRDHADDAGVIASHDQRAGSDTGDHRTGDQPHADQ